jgi:hypothetical protein
MRTLLVGTLSSLVALFGFAATASASSTIDLLWGGVSTNATIGLSSAAVLNVVLTNNGPLVSQGGGVTVDYSAALGKYSVVAFTNIIGTNGALNLALGTVTDTGSQIRNINAGAFVPFVGTGVSVGGSYLLGTVTFHKSAGPGGVFNITSVLTNTDGFTTYPGGGADVMTLNGATLTNAVPEPGTVSLLALGLGGLAFAARRK